MSCLCLLAFSSSEVFADSSLRSLKQRIRALEARGECYRQVRPNQGRDFRGEASALLSMELGCTAEDHLVSVNYEVFQDLGRVSNPTPVATLGDPIPAQLQSQVFEDTDEDGKADKVTIKLTAAEYFAVQASVECCSD